MNEARAVLDQSMSEQQLQDAVIETAERLGWLVAHIPDRLYKLAAKEKRYDAMPGAEGFPDLVLVHKEQPRMIIAELKSECGSVTPEQEEWLASMLRLASVVNWPWIDGGILNVDGPSLIYVAVWRPSDWSSGEIELLLTGAG